MFYKKLSVYQLQESPDKEILNEKFVALPARDCQDLEREHMGFVSPLVGSEEMVHQIEGASFFTIKTSSRVLPPSVVNEVVAKKQREIEKRENRKVGRKEKAELKDEVLVDLLPKAFQKSQDSRGYFDWTRGLLVVNETSANKCDSILSLIRNALGGLKAIPLQDFPDSKLVTSWVSTKTFPEGLEPGLQCKLANEEGKVSTQGFNLDDENLLSYITDGGCLVDEVGLTYDDRIEFTLRSGAWLSKMKFKDVVFENEATDYEDINQAIDANYALMLGEHRALLDFLSKEASVQ